MKPRTKKSAKTDLGYKVRETPLYNSVFVEKILQSRQDIQNGKGIKIDLGNLWK
ncbi:DUF2683 family protein [Mucilaginibacter pankratovii]|uniref:DUF2683 family protein n=1 Tax=Mucilaginibacter pankratovii TaxID=2772110 RepID=UPI003743F9CB